MLTIDSVSVALAAANSLLSKASEAYLQSSRRQTNTNPSCVQRTMVKAFCFVCEQRPKSVELLNPPDKDRF